MASEVCECGHGFLTHERIGGGWRCQSCRCVVEGPLDAPTARYKPPSAAPAAVKLKPATMALGEAMVTNELLAEGVRALISIAASLEKLANPPVLVAMQAGQLVELEKPHEDKP